MFDAFAIPPGSRILVTGSNGYIATHVVGILLQLGYNVRGTVRTPTDYLERYFQSRYGKERFETAIVPAIEDQDVFDQVLGDVSGVVHIASDTTMRTDPESVIPKVIAGNLNVLVSAAKYPNVKRVVLTSSSSALLIPAPNQRRRIDADTWNDESVHAAWNNGVPADKMPFTVYAASKTEGERSAWEWFKENKPGFEFNVVIPSLNFGKILVPEIHGSTMRYVRDLLKGDSFAIRLLPPKWCVNVEDTARLHVIALLAPEISSERLFAFAKPHNWTDIIGVLRKLRPENKLVPNPPENEGRDLTEVPPSKRAEELLKKYFERSGWTSLEESIAAGIGDLD